MEDKLAAYLRRDAFKATTLAAQDARQRGIRLHRSFWERAWVEENAAMASSFVFKATPAFVGLHSYMNDGGYLRGRIFIGRYCSIGRRVSIGAANHLMTGLSTSPAFRRSPSLDYSDEEASSLFKGARKYAASDVTILENDVWIGDGTVVLEGVRLGTGCIVAANAVVTRDVEPYAVVAGLPARRVKSRYPAEVIERLLASAWWNLPPSRLLALPTSHVLRTLELLESEGDFAPAVFETFMAKEAAPG